MPIDTSAVRLADGSLDCIVLFLAAHEIRDAGERARFFRELRRVLSASGRILLVEHPRDAANCMAYTMGAGHFHTPRAWRGTFEDSRLEVVASLRPAPLITAFVLKKHGEPA